MNTALKRLLAGILLLALIGTPVVSSCAYRTPPIQVELAFSEAPALGKPVGIAATFRLVNDHYRKSESNVTASIFLPEGFELVDGSLQWDGDFVRGETYSITAIVKSMKTGDWKVGAAALYCPGDGGAYGGIDILYVSVNDVGASVSNSPPPAEVPNVTGTDPPSGYPPPSWPRNHDPVIRQLAN